MNKIKKGNYYRLKTKKFYEEEGWRVEIIEKNQRIFTPKGVIFIKRDVWGADMVAVKNDEELWIQSKTNPVDINKGLMEFKKYPMPARVKQVVVIWQPRAKEPEIIEAK